MFVYLLSIFSSVQSSMYVCWSTVSCIPLLSIFVRNTLNVHLSMLSLLSNIRRRSLSDNDLSLNYSFRSFPSSLKISNLSIIVIYFCLSLSGRHFFLLLSFFLFLSIQWCLLTILYVCMTGVKISS